MPLLRQSTMKYVQLRLYFFIASQIGKVAQ